MHITFTHTVTPLSLSFVLSSSCFSLLFRCDSNGKKKLETQRASAGRRMHTRAPSRLPARRLVSDAVSPALGVGGWRLSLAAGPLHVALPADAAELRSLSSSSADERRHVADGRRDTDGAHQDRL